MRAHPKEPDPMGAARRLRVNFPERAMALSATLKKANRQKPTIPSWREGQVLNFIKVLTLFAGDLDERYRSRRVDSAASTVRNLIELHIWILYCNLSETNAQTFYEDTVRDVREMLDAVQALYTLVNGEPEERLAEMTDGLRAEAAAHGFRDYDDQYKKVYDAAREVGRIGEFRPLYKFYSKLTHPTALVLNPNNALDRMLDSVYDSGEKVAFACLREIEAFVRKLYPAVAL